jgi:hypothetical protein
MTLARKVERLGELAPNDAAYQLLLFAAGLTVIARGAYADEAAEGVNTLRAINEIMHQVTQQGYHALRGEPRYSDEDFAAIVNEMSTQSGLLDNITKEWDRAWRFTTVG